jgi:hypothetical protein
MAVTVLRVIGSIVAIPRPMRSCARPGFDGRPELRPVGGGDAEPDRGAGGAERLARGEDHRNHGVLALLTELILEGFGHIAHHTFECTSYFQCSQASGRAAPGSGGGLVGRSLPGPWRSQGWCLLPPWCARGRQVPVRFRLGELRRLGGGETELGEPLEAPLEQSLVLEDLDAGHSHEALSWAHSSQAARRRAGCAGMPSRDPRERKAAREAAPTRSPGT